VETLSAIIAGLTVGAGMLWRLLPKLNELLAVVKGGADQKDLRELIEGVKEEHDARLEAHDRTLSNHETRIARLEN